MQNYASITQENAEYFTRKFGSGVAAISNERANQLKKWSVSHDDSHDDEELLKAAMAILADHQDVYLEYSVKPNDSDWIDELVEKTRVNRGKQLAVAGALIAAEYDRLTRRK